MKITSITAQKKGERVNIFIDNKFYCGLSAESMVKYRLKSGQEITEERINEVSLESDKEVAFNKTLGLLSRRLKTVKEIKKYLYDKGYSQAVVDYCVDKLKEYKFVDDDNFADIYINASKSKEGKKMIKYKLKNRGVDEKIIDDKLSELGSQSEAIQALSKKYMKNKENNQVNAQKLYRYLLSKGFDAGEVQGIVREYRKEQDDESWD